MRVRSRICYINIYITYIYIYITGFWRVCAKINNKKQKSNSTSYIYSSKTKNYSTIMINDAISLFVCVVKYIYIYIFWFLFLFRYAFSSSFFWDAVVVFVIFSCFLYISFSASNRTNNDKYDNNASKKIF